MDRILAVRKVHGIMAPKVFIEMYGYKIPMHRRRDYVDIFRSHRHPSYNTVWKELMEEEVFKIEGSEYKLMELDNGYYFTKK